MGKEENGEGRLGEVDRSDLYYMICGDMEARVMDRRGKDEDRRGG